MQNPTQLLSHNRLVNVKNGKHSFVAFHFIDNFLLIM